MTLQTVHIATDEIVEQRIVQLLASHKVLSLSEIIGALAGLTKASHVRYILADLRQRNVVTTRAHHRGLWYVGYAIEDGSAPPQCTLDEIPQPFRALLSRRGW